MDQNYSIDEILLAVNEIQDIKKNNKDKKPEKKSAKKDYSDVPQHTLKLIEEAEETK